jgi:hypothetical protein
LREVILASQRLLSTFRLHTLVRLLILDYLKTGILVLRYRLLIATLVVFWGVAFLILSSCSSRTSGDAFQFKCVRYEAFQHKTFAIFSYDNKCSKKVFLSCSLCPGPLESYDGFSNTELNVMPLSSGEFRVAMPNLNHGVYSADIRVSYPFMEGRICQFLMGLGGAKYVWSTHSFNFTFSGPAAEWLKLHGEIEE